MKNKKLYCDMCGKELERLEGVKLLCNPETGAYRWLDTKAKTCIM